MRLARTLAVCFATAAVAAPAASARPQLPSPDSVDRNHPRQDLRSADTRDAAAGKETSLPPEVVTLRAQPPSAHTAVRWDDIAIGAGGMLGVGLLALGGASLVVRGRRPVAS